MPPKPARKRNRKRKRRIVSDSSSSEDSSSSSSSSSSTPNIPIRKPIDPVGDTSSSSSSSNESQDDSDSDSDQNIDIDQPAPSSSSKPAPAASEPAADRDSPSPPPTDIPPFIPPDAPDAEQVLKQKFRKFWMAAIADGFKDDLEAIRKEPNLGPSRLALLIESLASGADVFSSSSAGGGVNEMEVVLDQLS